MQALSITPGLKCCCRPCGCHAGVEHHIRWQKRPLGIQAAPLAPPPAITTDTVINDDSLLTILSCMQALDGVSGGRHDRAATKAQRPSTSSASPPAAAKLAAGSSVGHQQEASTKKGSSDSEPALTQTTSRDADRGRTEVRSGRLDTNPLCCLVVFTSFCFFQCLFQFC